MFIRRFLRWILTPTTPQKVRLVCMRLDEMVRVHPDQITLTCHLCHEQVGVYPSGQNVLNMYGNQVEIICNHCQPPDANISGLAPGAESEPLQSRWR